MKHLRIALFLVVACVLMLACWYYWREHRFDDVIRSAAARYETDPALVKAIIWKETRFKPHARGRAGEIGLMQIRSAAAGEWAEAEHIQFFDHAQCDDPETNVLASTWYLKKLLKRYTQTDNPVPYALADYNAGRSNLLKWKTGAAETNSEAFIEQIQFPSTKFYVRAVMRRCEQYREDF